MVNGRVGFQVNRLRGGGGIPGHPSVFSFHEKMAFKNAGRLFFIAMRLLQEKTCCCMEMTN